MSLSRASDPKNLSRYEILTKIASGGMARVYIGALRGPFGFEQLVAIKRLHEHLLEDEATRASFIDEARLAARIRHANVVDVRDVELVDDTLQLVMTYVEGATLADLASAGERGMRCLPPEVAIRIVMDACAGLHAAHELKDDRGKPLGLVHRDVSPQNLIVGVDGITRITDFGIARADSAGRRRTATGTLKGKFAYMAPEYINGAKPDRRLDVFALGVVLWEALAQRRLFKGVTEGETVKRVLGMEPPGIGDFVPELRDSVDPVLRCALAKDPEERFSTAEALGTALDYATRRSGLVAAHADVARYVREIAREDLERMAESIRQKKRELLEVSVASEDKPPAGAAEQASSAIASAAGSIESIGAGSLPLFEEPKSTEASRSLDAGSLALPLYEEAKSQSASRDLLVGSLPLFEDTTKDAAPPAEALESTLSAPKLPLPEDRPTPILKPEPQPEMRRGPLGTQIIAPRKPPAVPEPTMKSVGVPQAEAAPTERRVRVEVVSSPQIIVPPPSLETGRGTMPLTSAHRAAKLSTLPFSRPPNEAKARALARARARRMWIVPIAAVAIALPIVIAVVGRYWLRSQSSAPVPESAATSR